ncbi:MAG: hypothetical protein KKD01_02575 [Proteobacteria bacterium]|nr:hypothetical protein [Pseudomonadota bacterium]MBU1233858.1 hypothetical protein [Pseudomonadota bacterium]MBU1418950.1 hypothetical protein [Pseudomonadota bacterium]MBU1453587.1 hypothetical protein [Pseudomonadota bacterium]
MKTSTYTITPVITALFLFFFLFVSPLAFAGDDNKDMSLSQDILVVQGKVKSFNREKQTLTIKTSKGDRMTILLNWNTALVGYSSLQEIDKDHGVKIWYVVEEKKHTAVKIEKKIEVGC